jgi:hypothetical protein
MAILLVSQSDMVGNLFLVFGVAAQAGFAEISLSVIRAELMPSVEKTGGAIL